MLHARSGTAFSGSNDGKSARNVGGNERKEVSFTAARPDRASLSRYPLPGQGRESVHFLLFRTSWLQRRAPETAGVRDSFARPTRPSPQRSGRVRLAPDARRTFPGTGRVESSRSQRSGPSLMDREAEERPLAFP